MAHRVATYRVPLFRTLPRPSSGEVSKRLNTAAGVAVHMGRHITNRSYCTHAATHSTTPPFNFYCVNRASQVSKDCITWSNWNNSISTSSAFWFSFNFMFIYNKRHYLQPYTVPNCCGHTLYRTDVGIPCTEMLWTYKVLSKISGLVPPSIQQLW
jgi:hypothetical protein